LSNVTDLFEIEEPTKENPTFTMEVKRKGGEAEIVHGYPVVNQLFGAVCQGDGIIQWVTPFENLDYMKNLGEVNPTVN
jgi:hypothetical protein